MRTFPSPSSTSPSAPSSGAELVEILDVAGQVAGVVTRAKMRAEKLRHRCSYIVVLTSDRQIVVHKRADWKEVYPGWWDLAFGGVVSVGESWEDSAKRELAEESGLTGINLVPLGALTHSGPQGAVIGRVFLAHSDEEPTCPDGEVVAVDHVPVDQLDAWIVGKQVCSDSLQGVLPLLEAYRASIS